MDVNVFDPSVDDPWLALEARKWDVLWALPVDKTGRRIEYSLLICKDEGRADLTGMAILICPEGRVEQIAYTAGNMEDYPLWMHDLKQALKKVKKATGGAA